MRLKDLLVSVAVAGVNTSGPAPPKADDIAPQQASRADSPDKGKLRVFISYSRDDLYFANQLDAALKAYGFECFIDREGISGGEEWKQRLGNLIRDADTVVFVLSPTSARSEICAWEVGEAARLGKRIVPVNCQPLEGAIPPPRLRDLNYIFFYADPKVLDSGFGTGLLSLVEALNTDFDWLREHTRYLQRATEWDSRGRPPNRLLSGDDIAEAKAWVARRPKNAPEPTALHLDFIRASEEEAEARSSAQRKQLEAMAAAQAERETALRQAEEALKQAADAQRRRARIRNIAFVVVSVFAVLAGWLYLRADKLRQEAEEQRAQADDILAGATSIIVKTQDQMNIDTQQEVFALFRRGAEAAGASCPGAPSGPRTSGFPCQGRQTPVPVGDEQSFAPAGPCSDLPAAFARRPPASGAVARHRQASADARSRPRSRPGRSSGAAWLRARLSRSVGSAGGDNPIDALALCLRGFERQPKLLAHHGGEEAAHRVRLPAGGAHDAGNRGAVRSVQQRKHPRLFRVRSRLQMMVGNVPADRLRAELG